MEASSPFALSLPTALRSKAHCFLREKTALLSRQKASFLTQKETKHSEMQAENPQLSTMKRHRKETMKRILIPLCLILCTAFAGAQRTNRYETPQRLFVEGKEFFNQKNYAGCIDKLSDFKHQTKDPDLIQEADYMIAASLFEQGVEGAMESLMAFREKYPDARQKDVVNFYIATDYFEEEEYEKALFWLNESEIDNLSVEQQEVHTYRMAYALLQTGEAEKAYGHFARIAEIGDTYRQPSTYYMAYIDYQQGRYDDALTTFAQLKDDKAYQERALFYTMQIHFIQNNLDKAATEAKQLITEYPKSKDLGEAFRILGNASYRQGDYAQATAYLEDYMKQTEKPLRGDLYMLGICQFKAGDYEQAASLLEQTVYIEDALSQSAYLYLGQCYLKLHDKNNARMAFEAAATASFDRQIKEIATYNYALLIHETSFAGFGESVSIFEDFLNDFPQSKYSDRVNDYLVEVYLTTKNYAAALASIEKIKTPSQKILQAKQDILFQLGTEAFTNADMDHAIGLFSQAIALGAYDPTARNNAYFWRGEALFRQEEYGKAITDFRQYISNSRNTQSEMYSLSHYNIGYSYFKMKQYDEALGSFQRFASSAQTTNSNLTVADAHNRIGDCLFYNRRFSEAEQSYARAAQLQPSAGDYSVYQKGFLLGLQKNYTEKIAVMDRLITEFPESQYVDDALFEKGRAYVMQENDTKAAASFEQLTQQFPESSLARKAGVQLGLIYFNGNQTAKAAEAYKRVVEKYPGSDESKVALQDLKSVYLEMNDIESYANYVNSLDGNIRFEATEQDSLTYLAAEKLFMRGDNEGARTSMRRYLQTYPDGAFSTSATYYLANIAYNTKDYAEAKRLYDAVLQSGDTKFRETALLRKAQMEYKDKAYPAALTTYKQLLTVAENPVNKETAKVGIMRSAYMLSETPDVLFAVDALLKDKKLSPELKTEAHYSRAKVYLKEGKSKAAIEDLSMLSKDTRTVYGAEATYQLAQVYFDTKQDAEAEKVLMKFMEEGTPHQYWLARGFVLLADIFISKGDDFQARQYLTSLQNNYKAKDDIAGMIQERLAKLKK